MTHTPTTDDMADENPFTEVDEFVALRQIAALPLPAKELEHAVETAKTLSIKGQFELLEQLQERTVSEMESSEEEMAKLNDLISKAEKEMSHRQEEEEKKEDIAKAEEEFSQDS